MSLVQCPNCLASLEIGLKSVHVGTHVGTHVGFMSKNRPPVEAAAAGLFSWLASAGRTLPTDRFVPSYEVHEQFLDWLLRRDLAPFTQRVTLTALTRHIGAGVKRRWDGVKLYSVPVVVAPDLVVPEPWSSEWADRLEPDDYPWVRRLRDQDETGRMFAAQIGVEPNLAFAEGLAWSEAHRWARPPQAGWPWWRIPLPGEEVPA